QTAGLRSNRVLCREQFERAAHQHDARDRRADAPESDMISLAHALPELRTAEQKLKAWAAARGIVYVFADLGGVRTAADTADAMRYRDAEYQMYLRTLKPGHTPIAKETWRPIAPFGHSYHNYGAAFD